MVKDDSHGVLNILTVNVEHSLHADDDRDDIKVKIAEERVRESFYE